MFRKNLTVTLLLIFVISLATSCSKENKVPEVTATDLDGQTIKLSDYKGKVVMLNFWATWCPPCRQEIPDFIKMYEKHENEGLVILGIGGFSEDASKIKSFVAAQGINYPIAVLNPKLVQKTSADFGEISGIPTTFLIDREGIIRQKWEGPRSEEIFMAEVNKYLK